VNDHVGNRGRCAGITTILEHSLERHSTLKHDPSVGCHRKEHGAAAEPLGLLLTKGVM
jgi:hypothetical protein